MCSAVVWQLLLLVVGKHSPQEVEKVFDEAARRESVGSDLVIEFLEEEELDAELEGFH